MLPILNIGPLAIQTPGLVWIIGLWIGLSLAERFAATHQVHPDRLSTASFVALAAGVVGARLAYVLQYPTAFVADPLGLVSPSPALLDPLGFWVGSGLGIIAYAQRTRVSLIHLADALTPLLATVQIAAGVANLASGEAYGALTQLPWGIALWGTLRHPTQIYEILAGAAILWFIWPRRTLFTGLRFWLFIAFSAGARLFLEAFRGDSTLLLGALRPAQLAAWLVLAISLWQIAPLIRQPSHSSTPKEKL